MHNSLQNLWQQLRQRSHRATIPVETITHVESHTSIHGKNNNLFIHTRRCYQTRSNSLHIEPETRATQQQHLHLTMLEKRRSKMKHKLQERITMTCRFHPRVRIQKCEATCNVHRDATSPKFIHHTTMQLDGTNSMLAPQHRSTTATSPCSSVIITDL